MQLKQKVLETEAQRTLYKQIAIVAETDAGIALMQWLRAECGADMPSICLTKDGAIDAHLTVYNEARRDIWLRLRQLIPHSQLVLIELPLPKALQSDIEGL